MKPNDKQAKPAPVPYLPDNLSPDLHQRITAAGAKLGLTFKQYILDAILDKLRRDKQ